VLRTPDDRRGSPRRRLFKRETRGRAARVSPPPAVSTSSGGAPSLPISTAAGSEVHLPASPSATAKLKRRLHELVSVQARPRSPSVVSYSRPRSLPSADRRSRTSLPFRLVPERRLPDLPPVRPAAVRFSRQVSVSAMIMLSACNTAIFLLDAFLMMLLLVASDIIALGGGDLGVSAVTIHDVVVCRDVGGRFLCGGSRAVLLW
jgi:hypothetical protein